VDYGKGPLLIVRSATCRPDKQAATYTHSPAHIIHQFGLYLSLYYVLVAIITTHVAHIFWHNDNKVLLGWDIDVDKLTTLWNIHWTSAVMLPAYGVVHHRAKRRR